MNERSIFLAALDILDPARRAAYLDEVCAGDAAVRRGVDELLAAHERSGSFMPVPVGGPTIDDDPPGEGPGSRVGPYKLLQRIGAGGMGVVFMAEQEQPVRRTVALKIIRAGMDSKAVLARFEAERQALALMDHPNIAKVLDAGATDSGRPYFVMELVKGVPITQFCDEHQLTVRERLSLFVPVCQAIQHAHQKGVIHRDIKPSNVLVAEYDDKAVPKVIDFGVAKATSQKLTEKTLFTAFGTVVGTLEYMSPEQAKMNQLDVDTRSDVYTLGVLLYELLTGTTPLDRARLRSAALDEVLRLIREEEPVRPSTRLSTAQTRPALAAARRSEPGKLGQVLRGELDWIVMKALEKDRTRRYETANGLARDVERYLKDEPVEACPPTVGYRLRKLYQKNRAAAAVAAAFALLLALAAVVGTALAVQARRAERAAQAERARAEEREAEANEQRERAEQEKRRAEEEKKAAQAVRDFLQDDLLRQANPLHQAEVGRAVSADLPTKSNPTVQELLERAGLRLTPERIEARFPAMPFVQAEVLNAVGDAYYGMNEDAKAEQYLSRAYALYQSARGPDDPATLEAGFRLARARLILGRTDEGVRLMEDVYRRQARVLGPYHDGTLKSRLHLEMNTARVKGPAAALPLLKRHIEDALAHRGPDDQRTLYATFYHGFLLQMAGQVEEGFRVMNQVWEAVRRAKLRADHPDVEAAMRILMRAYQSHGRMKEATSRVEEYLAVREAQCCAPTLLAWSLRHQLGWALAAEGKIDEAARTFEKNLPVSPPPGDETTLEAIASMYQLQGRVEDAIAQLQKARDLKVKRNGVGHRGFDMGRVKARIGLALLQLKKYTEAEPLLTGGYEEMAQHLDQMPSWDRGVVTQVSQSILQLYRETNRPDEARKWLDARRTAVENNLNGLRAGPSKEASETLATIASLARGYVDVGQKEEAVRLFRATSDRLQATGWPLDEPSLNSLTRLRYTVRLAGRFDLAADMSGAIVAELRKLPGKKVPLGRELLALCLELCRAKRFEEAEKPARELLQLWGKSAPNDWNLIDARRWLAASLLHQKKYSEAEPLMLKNFQDAVSKLDSAPAWGKRYPAAIADNLIRLYEETGKPDEVKKWQAERAKHDKAKPRAKK